jgi:hypothetical protein
MFKKVVTIELPQSELAKFRQWSLRQNKELTQECRKIIAGTIGRIERMAKTNAPVNFGYLRSSIHKLISYDELGGAVYTGRKYAPYQEWGTGSRVNVPSFVKEMFGVDSMDWKGKGLRKVNTKPHPYLFHAARIGYMDMISRLKKLGFKEDGKTTKSMNKSVIISNMTY